jgi:hypothetical protein
MTTTKTHWKKYFHPDYIGAYALEPGEEKTVRIKHVKQEQVTGINGKKEECTVAHLDGEKPFILNRTNCKTITKIYGSPFIEDWSGKSITIYAAKVSAFGEEVEALRIRQRVPQPLKPLNYAANIAAVEACKTLDELKAVFTGFTPPEQAATVAVKDRMKLKLQEAAQ